jgi:DNA-binding SARP family transcriptional activator
MQGYTLTLADGEYDAGTFESLCRDGSAALERGDPVAGSRMFTAALRLWRGDGEPFGALDRPGPVAYESTRLVELRLAAMVHYAEAALILGRHNDLVPELRTWVTQHPLQERLRSQLAVALYRTGRKADALDSCREGRQLSITELGVDPSSMLQEVEHAILTDRRTLVTEHEW